MRRALLVLLLLFVPAHAEEVPYLTGPLVDEARWFSAEEARRVTRALESLNASNKVQMAVLVAESLRGDSIEGFSIKVAEQWKLGTKGVDNGLLMVIAPEDRRMRLEVGYGLEGDIPDAYAKRIIDDGVAPYFRAGRKADGVIAAVAAVARILKVELSGTPVQPVRTTPRGTNLPTWIFILILFAIMGFNFFWLPRGRAHRYGRRGSSHWYGGGWGGGGFGGGGFSGGGFGGGGGGFGGGGASGGW